MYIFGIPLHSLSQQIIIDNQVVTSGEMSAQDSNLSSYIDTRSTSIFKVNEEYIEF